MAKFRVGDRVYDFEGEYTLEEAMLYYDKANIGMAELQRELLRGNPYVTVTFMYILKKRAGEAVRWQDLTGYSIVDVEQIPEDEPDGDEEDAESSGAALDPTEGAGTTPGPDTTST